MFDIDSKVIRIAFCNLSQALLALGLVAGGGTAQAQATYPDRPVRLVVPYGAGGNADLQSRIIAQELREALGQPFVVDNRAGATGIIGTDIAAKATPDGYTLLFIASPHAITPGLVAKLPFDPVKDFAAITLVGSTPLIISVTPALPAKTIKELVALAKAKPGQLNYASARGGPGHLAGALFNSVTGVNIVYVPYKSTAQVLTDLMGGQVPLAYPSATSVLPHIKAGRVRGLAITGRQRSALAPELMMAAEAGLPGYEASIWSGMLAPARTPRPIIERLHTTLINILKRPEVKNRIIGLGADPMTSTSAEFAAFITAEIKKWGQVIKDSDVRAD